MNRILKNIKSRFADLSITKKIYLFNVVVVIIPITILVLISTKVSSDSIIDKAVKNSEQNLNIINESLNSLFINIEDMSRVVAANKGVLDALRKVWQIDWQVVKDTEELDYYSVVRAILDNVSGMKTTISSMSIYGAKGQYIGSGYFNSSKAPEKKTLDIKLVQESYAMNGESIWFDAFSSPWTKDTQNITMLQAIISPQTRDFIGVAEVKIDKGIFSQLYAQLNYGKAGRYFIINDKGIVVSSEKEVGVSKDIIKKNYQEWINNKGNKTNIFKVEKDKYLIDTLKFKHLNWVIVGMIPVNELLGDNKKVTATVYIIGIVCILLELVFSYLISRWISKPIIELSRNMVSAGQGDLEVRVDVRSRDEVGTMSRTFNDMVGRISGLMDQVYIEQKKERELQFQALQAQINPHFLYNALESVCALAQLKRTDEVFDMVKSLALFYRIVLSGGDSIITIKDEIKNVTHYLKIQKIRYSEKFDYNLNIDESIMEFKIVKLSIQPLVENAIYHGLKNIHGKGRLWIIGKKVENEIRISVIDNGIGIPEDELKNLTEARREKSEKRSFGLRSIDERIKLCFGKMYGIKVKSIYSKWTKIDIILPNDEDI